MGTTISARTIEQETLANYYRKTLFKVIDDAQINLEISRLAEDFSSLIYFVSQNSKEDEFGIESLGDWACACLNTISHLSQIYQIYDDMKSYCHE